MDESNANMGSALYKAPGQYEYEGIIKKMPNFPPSSMDKIKTFPFQEGDVVIAAYPKSGHTWVSQIVTLIASKGDTDSDLMKEDMQKRVKYMELQFSPQAPANIDILTKTPAPRVMKSHLPASIFKEGLDAGKAKFIIVMRNPKDCLVSYYHFYLAMVSMGPFTGTWDEFFKLFKGKGLMDGDWLDVNVGWWQERHRDSVLILKYEDIKRDPKACILKCASFCGEDLSDDALQKIVEASSFDSMKSNPLVNMTSIPKFVYDQSKGPFMRKGIVGDWKNVFTKEQSDYVDKHYTAEAAKHGLHFDFDI